jgi:hypothetical protein
MNVWVEHALAHQHFQTAKERSAMSARGTYQKQYHDCLE